MTLSMREQVHSTLLDPSDRGLKRLAALHALVEGREAWKLLREDPSITDAAIDAIRRSGALEEVLEPRPRILVEDLLSALRSSRTEPGLAVLLAVWSSAPQLEVQQRAGLVLVARAEPEGLLALVHSLDEVRGGLRRIALQALFTRDATSAWDALEGRFAAASPEAADVLYETLHVLMSDLNDDGRAHWGASRRWFEADPRWRALCEAWSTLPKDRDAWGRARAQGIVETAAWLRKRVRG